MIEKFSRILALYQGKAVGFRCDEVVLPNGKLAQREFLTHKGAVAIVPLLDSPKKVPIEKCRIVMVEQYRYPVGRKTLEIPAGKFDRKESLLECVARELQEETGYRAKKIHSLIPYCPTPAFSQEVIHLYWTDTLIKGKSHPDDDEFLKVKVFTLGHLIEKIRRGEIRDSKTIIALLASCQFLGNKSS